jgi:uncharacterized Zn ribbon protein
MNGAEQILGQCQMAECDNEEGLKTCSDPEDNRLVMCPSCWSDWPVKVIKADGGVFDRAINRDWPDCIRCGSDETTVVPKTGEWTCQDCGCQWTSGETQVDDGDGDQIPNDIETMLDAFVDAVQPSSDPIEESNGDNSHE